MRDSIFEGLAMGLLVSGIVALFLYAACQTGHEEERDAIRASALQAGSAHWAIGTDGERRFDWGRACDCALCGGGK